VLIRYGKEQNGRLIKKAAVYTREEHKINFADVDSDAVFITGRLRANGHESYIVGGAVRDLILGKKPKDFDIVTDAIPARIKRIFRNSRIIGKRFRLVHVYFGPKIFEVSTFRSIKDGHTGNTYGAIEEDVLRRDFSCNALFYDPGKQVVVDYVNGMNDIRKRLLQPIIPQELIFRDDPVRMIRAVKYAAAADFSIPWILKRRIKKEANLLEQVSPSRLTEELSKIIRSPAASKIVKNLDGAGLYGYLQKEASALMRRDPAFCRAYLAGFGKAAPSPAMSAGKVSSAVPGSASGAIFSTEGTVRRRTKEVDGWPLTSLVRNYLELKAPWQALKKGSWEDYRAVFFDTRRFILPMNPPRIELEQAVRIVLAEHGIELKKTRVFEREPRKQDGLVHPQAKTEEQQKPKQRRNRRKNAAAAKSIAELD